MLKVAFLSRASWPLFYIFKYLFPCSCSALASDETSSPALASLSWAHLFLPRLWKPAPAWVRSALDNPHLPPRPRWGIRRWMDGWIFNFLLPSLHPLASRTDTYMLWELLCAESWAVLEMSLTKKNGSCSRWTATLKSSLLSFVILRHAQPIPFCQTFHLQKRMK